MNLEKSKHEKLKNMNILTGDDREGEIEDEKKGFYEEKVWYFAKGVNKSVRYCEYEVGGESDPSTSYELTFGGRIFKTESSREATWKLAYDTLLEEENREIQNKNREEEIKNSSPLKLRKDCDINTILNILGYPTIEYITYAQLEQLYKVDYKFNRLNLLEQNQNQN